MDHFGVWRTNQHYVANRAPYAITQNERDARLIGALISRDGNYGKFRPCVAHLVGREWEFMFHVEDDGSRGADLRIDTERYDKGRAKTRRTKIEPEWDNVRTLDLGEPVQTRTLPPIPD